MGIRRDIAKLLLGPPEVTEADLRRVAEAAARTGGGADPELARQVAKLEKKLNMAMGAVQAATAQIMALKKDVEELAATASQAHQHATTARSTAEATAEGLAALEEQLAAGSPARSKGRAKTPKGKKAARTCSVDGCSKPHRAKGYCASHYQQYKRGTLG